MAKSSSKSSSKRSGDGRPKPMAPRAGVTSTRRRYEEGGKRSK